MTDEFTPAERAALAPYFTNLDGPVFALVSLPEVVKGALFARYSRSPKSLRRLFLDEFLTTGPLGTPPPTALDTARADQLYERVFSEYGDDSVAQLGGVHLACEGASNLLTKVLEWGRLMAYLEQSTRYIPYDDRPQGRYRYHVPAELGDRVVAVLAEHALVELVGARGVEGRRRRRPQGSCSQELVEEEPAQRLRRARVAREERALDDLGQVDEGEDGPVEIGEVRREGRALVGSELVAHAPDQP